MLGVADGFENSRMLGLASIVTRARAIDECRPRWSRAAAFSGNGRRGSGDRADAVRIGDPDGRGDEPRRGRAGGVGKAAEAVGDAREDGTGAGVRVEPLACIDSMSADGITFCQL